MLYTAGIVYVDAGYPMSTARPLNYQSIKHKLFKRSERSHKGNNGHVLVIGGDHGFGGAPLLAAEAAARSGAGLVSVATRPEHCPAFLARCPELMVKGISNPAELPGLIKAASFIIAGPGLGQSSWSVDCLKAAFLVDRPILLDADALNLIAQERIDAPLPRHHVMTPHPGEAARLLGCKTEDIQNDREQACLSLQAKYGGVVVLKGAGTLIAARLHERVQLSLCNHGNPGMGTGGMGDALSGVIGGLAAQGFPLLESAELGVCIHGLSADLVARESGERGMLASDLLPHIHRLVNNL